MKVLVVDDDPELRDLVAFALRKAGLYVIEADGGERALELARAESPNLLILDVNMPGMSGFDVCREVRRFSQAPVMMLTVRSTEDAEIEGLEAGADDYLVKPFSPRTLLARARALLRRQGAGPATLQVGRLRLDPDMLSVQVGDAAAVALTQLEFRLLQGLAAQAGRAVSADRLVTHVWGARIGPDRRQLKQLVHRVRQKIEADPADPRYLLTVAGVGYRLEPGGNADPA